MGKTHNNFSFFQKVQTMPTTKKVRSTSSCSQTTKGGVGPLHSTTQNTHTRGRDKRSKLPPFSCLAPLTASNASKATVPCLHSPPATTRLRMTSRQTSQWKPMDHRYRVYSYKYHEGHGRYRCIILIGRSSEYVFWKEKKVNMWCRGLKVSKKCRPQSTKLPIWI